MSETSVSGVERIAEAFESAHAEGRRAALMPYLMAGYPDLERSAEILAAYVQAGADLIELGIPFSDPLADGPVIHAAAVAALASGVRTMGALQLARQVSDRIAVVVMCYSNLIVARGVERFADSLAAVGASGLIVPDLPFEEAPAMLAALDARGLALVPLVAPTTPEARLAAIGGRARGFLYTVSVTGTTGERVHNDGGLAQVLSRARAHTEVPVAVGFGIGTPQQAREAADAGADGVIIGSRLVREAGSDPHPAGPVGALVSAFAGALR
ncbi:MAG: tryptophan synthase subunit alpha [Solirubrobacteraceae bacterium]